MNDYISIDQFIAEIESKYPVLAESGDIDKSSIVFTVINALRKFGVNVQKLKSEFLIVENSRSRLPDDFKMFKKGYWLTPVGHSIEGNRQDVTDNYIYRERIENPAYYNEITHEYVRSCDSKIVTEKITLGNSKLNYHYRHQPLEIVGGVESNSLSADCIIYKSPYKASISNSILNTNFDRGNIYMEYYSLQTDENGDMVIPIFSIGAIYDYIENLVKIDICEYIINNNLNPQGISQLYSVAKQESVGLRNLAMKESKFHGLGKNWNKEIAKTQRKSIAKYYRFPR